ncbi:MAG: acyltransferase family protein [Myxococcales bacterium]|nr:acyltransferase family protein [Myxococcales bacterium]
MSARALRRLGDRAVRLASELTGEDIDARIATIQTVRSETGHDPFGFDPDTSRYMLAVTTILHRRYFRTEVTGIEALPPGRVMLVANHSGQLPLDGMMIATATMLDADPPRFARTTVEKWTAELPFVSYIFPRTGQIVGSPENARRLLQQEQALVAFPEGVHGIVKTFDQRYQLMEFGLGFMRLALETDTPIVPVAVIGAEEQYPSIANVRPLAKLLGVPAFPIVPQLLFGMLAPLPTKYHLRFGEPMRFSGHPDDDDAEIGKHVWVVKTAIEAMLQEGLDARESVFF